MKYLKILSETFLISIYTIDIMKDLSSFERVVLFKNCKKNIKKNVFNIKFRLFYSVCLVYQVI